MLIQTWLVVWKEEKREKYNVVKGADVFSTCVRERSWGNSLKTTVVLKATPGRHWLSMVVG